MNNRIMLSLFVISLTATFFCFSRQAVCLNNEMQFQFKTQCFLSLDAGGFPLYQEKVRPAWRGRLFSNGMANVFMSISKVNPEIVRSAKIALKDFNRFANTVAAWNTLWFIASFLLIIKLSKHKSVAVFGVFACMMYAFTPRADNLIQPWDGPALFFYSLIIGLSLSRNRKWIAVIIPLAVGFKETALVLAFLPLFWSEWNLNRRLVFSALIISFGVSVKIVLDAISGCPIPFLTMQTHYDTINRFHHYWSIAQNVDFLFIPSINHPLFAIGGLLMIIFGSPLCRGFKTIAVIHIAGIFMFCIINESRLFQELIPLYFLGLKNER
jgi:hypothetical protein